MSATCLGVLLVVLCLRTAAAQKEGDLRLVNGKKCGEGRVEIYHSGEWGTVCDDRFDIREARVICKQLNYRDAIGYKHVGHYGAGTGRIWMDGLQCTGTEKELSHCKFNGFGKHDCKHREDAGVVCQTESGLEDVPLRLSCPPDHEGSCNTCPIPRGAGRQCSQSVAVQGIVEVQLKGKWQPVSGKGWNKNSARVVCGMLGYPVAMPSPSLETLWPEWSSCALNTPSEVGSGDLLSCSSQQQDYLRYLQNTILDNMHCTGGESKLTKCCFLQGSMQSTRQQMTQPSVATVSCGYNLDLECFGNSPAETYRLRGATLPWMGRVEVNKTRVVGTVCDHGWSLEAASIVCRSLGYGTAAELFTRAHFGRGGGTYVPTHYSELGCTGKEITLSQCSSKRASTRCFEHSGDAGLRCNTPDESSCNNIKPATVRLSDIAHPRGPSQLISMLEVLHDGKWGRVCGDLKQRTFGTVACRDARAMFAARVRTVADKSYSGPRFSGEFECTGDELTAAECKRNLSEVKECSKGYVVLDCSSDLPDLVPDVQQFYFSLILRPTIQRIALAHLKCAYEEKCLSSSAIGKPRNNLRHLLRFNSLTMNYGKADFLPSRQPHQYQWHSCHRHYHSFERFVDYDLLDLDGNKVADGHKASFCLEDSLCVRGTPPSYRCRAQQGISINCGDLYGASLDCQWIDVTDVPTGKYVLRNIINPSRDTIESDYRNNEISCRIDINIETSRIRVHWCSHSDH